MTAIAHSATIYNLNPAGRTTSAVRSCPIAGAVFLGDIPSSPVLHASWLPSGRFTIVLLFLVWLFRSL